MIDILFIEIAAVIITAGLVALFAHFLRQPLIIAYLFTGLIVGPSIFGLTESQEVFKALSEIGIAFLLFLVGLGLNWRHIKEVGGVSLAGGLGQVFFTSVVGALIASLFGFNVVTSIFLGIAFAFSSTIIIVKLLSDKEDINRFYGRISIGSLIVQDLVAMILLLVVGAMRDNTLGSVEAIISVSLLKLVIVIGALYFVAKLLLPPLFRYAARSQELLFLTAVSWCFVLASSLHFLGFGIEIGALLAGISIAGLEFSREIEFRVRPLRDFFLIIFFIFLGTTLSLDALQAALVPGLVFSAFILIGNPIIFLLVLRAMGYHPRTGFLVGVTMAQISEFSFIFLASAAAAGLVSEEILPLTTVVALITIAASTYIIKYNEQIYERIEFLFRPLEGVGDIHEHRLPKAPEIVMFGYHRIGKTILPTLKKLKQEYLVVDIDPAAIKHMQENNIPHVYGDAGNQELLKELRAEKAKIIISTIPDDAISRDIIAYLRKTKRSKPTIIVTVKTSEQALELYEAGANFVIVPNILGGEYFAELLKRKKVRKSSWTVAAKKQKKAFGV